MPAPPPLPTRIYLIYFTRDNHYVHLPYSFRRDLSAFVTSRPNPTFVESCFMNVNNFDTEVKYETKNTNSTDNKYHTFLPMTVGKSYVSYCAHRSGKIEWDVLTQNIVLWVSRQTRSRYRRMYPKCIRICFSIVLLFRAHDIPPTPKKNYT